MRALVVTDFGAPPKLLDIERPEPGAGEVRVRVRAASVNGFDTAVAAGYLKGMMEHRFPVVLGKDFAGEIDAGHTVLIVGATGGVGNQVVQLAARAGAHVIATADVTSEAHVRDLGAAEVIDYTGDVPAAVLAAHPGGVDVVVHLAGDPTALLSTVRPGGKFISTLIGSPDQLPSDTVTVLPIFANPTGDILNRLAGNQDNGDTKVTVQQTYPLENAAQALTDFSAGTVGKRVIVID